MNYVGYIQMFVSGDHIVALSPHALEYCWVNDGGGNETSKIYTKNLFTKKK